MAPTDPYCLSSRRCQRPFRRWRRRRQLDIDAASRRGFCSLWHRINAFAMTDRCLFTGLEILSQFSVLLDGHNVLQARELNLDILFLSIHGAFFHVVILGVSRHQVPEWHNHVGIWIEVVGTQRARPLSALETDSCHFVK